MTIHDRIQQEKETARKKYGAFNSTHEAYGVLKEEVEEFWDSVKHKSYSEPGKQIKINDMISELIQIAAVAQQIAEELQANEIKHV